MNVEIYELYASHVVGADQYENGELRYDLLRERWVLVSAARGRKPGDYASDDYTQEPYDTDSDSLAGMGDVDKERDTLIYRNADGEWTTRVMPNKFPVVTDTSLDDLSDGPYPGLVAAGTHEIVVTRDGRRTFALLSQMELAEVIDAYQERYLALMKQRDVRSITIFHNHGKGAGSTLKHPHSQILALPIVASTIMRELDVVSRYKKQSGMHLFSLISQYEAEQKMRVIYENDDFIAYCPFASRRAYEVRIIPKVPQPYFERITREEKISLADALGTVLGAIYEGLDDPDYNYFIRTAPCNGQDYPDFSYYVEVLPRTHIYTGFEAATDIDIVPLAPEDAAAYLREFIGTSR